MKVLMTNAFEKAAKRLHKRYIIEVKSVINTIKADPMCGELKRGDLAGVYVYKFRLDKQLILLAYTFQHNELTLLSLGPHENFYRDLKNKQ